MQRGVLQPGGKNSIAISEGVYCTTQVLVKREKTLAAEGVNLPSDFLSSLLGV